MNKEVNEIFKQWKQFLSLCYENNDKTTEIYRDDLERVIVYTKKLENIIKEVREYIEEHIAMFKNGDMLVDMNIDELLEILDKENI